MSDHLADIFEIYCLRNFEWDLIENLKPKSTWIWILALGARLCKKTYLKTHHEFQQGKHQKLCISYQQLTIADLHMSYWSKIQTDGLTVICFPQQIYIKNWRLFCQIFFHKLVTIILACDYWWFVCHIFYE